MRRNIIFLLLAVFLVLPFGLEATTITNDLGLRRIWFSKNELVAYDTVRLYAEVLNYGTTDMRAYVSFWNGAEQIGLSQPISVRAGGFVEEVFVDFNIPNNPFNIRVVIQAPDPTDDNPANDEIMTNLFTPVLDSDSDGVSDARDNCPNVLNADQKDTDGDAVGDVCDADDDNDGLLDVRELVIGTNLLAVDTDGDNVSDKDDAFPRDAGRSAEPQPQRVLPPPQTQTAETVNDISDTNGGSPQVNTDEIENNVVIGSGAVIEEPNQNSLNTVDGVAQNDLLDIAAESVASVRDISDGADSDINYRDTHGNALTGFWRFTNPYFWLVILFFVSMAVVGFVLDRRNRAVLHDDATEEFDLVLDGLLLKKSRSEGKDTDGKDKNQNALTKMG